MTMDERSGRTGHPACGRQPEGRWAGAIHVSEDKLVAAVNNVAPPPKGDAPTVKPLRRKRGAK